MQGRPSPILVVGAMLLLIAGGSAVLQRDVAETMEAALILSVLWAGIVGLGFLVYAAPRNLLGPVIGGLAAGAVLAAASFYWFSVRDDEVDEDVVVATEAATGGEAEQGLAGGGAGEPKPNGGKASKSRNVSLARGEFVGADGHDGRGTATVVARPDGSRTLTFTDFEVDPAVQMEVWLTPGPEQTEDRISLGGLKGNVGDQQYEIPADADLTRYDTVIVYCVPFTVRIAVAELGTA